MTDHDGPDSPLEPVDNALGESAGSPFGPGPAWASTPAAGEQPRLGIIHLLVWMTCVAFCLGMVRAVLATLPRATVESDTSMIPWFLHGIGRGTALGGLLLYVARNGRRQPFPTHPGEYLLVALGCVAALNLAFDWALGRMFLRLADTGDFPMLWWKGYVLASSAATTLVFLVAAVKVTATRWRVVLLSATVPMFSAMFNTLADGSLYPPAFYLFPSVVLVVVLVMDLAQGRRYPWTHWLGAGVQLWFGVCILVTIVLSWLVVGVR